MRDPKKTLPSYAEVEAERQRMVAEARAAGKMLVLLPFIPFDVATLPRRQPKEAPEQ